MPSTLAQVLTRVGGRISVRLWVIGARVLRVAVGIIPVRVAGRIVSHAARIGIAGRSIPSATHRNAIPHTAIAGERAGNAAGRLLLFPSLNRAAEFDRTVSDVHVHIVIAQRGLVVQRVLDLTLNGAGIVYAHTRRCSGRPFSAGW